MGSYNHSDHPLREARSNVVEDRVGDIFNKIDEMCNEKGDNTTDVLFEKLVQDLNIVRTIYMLMLTRSPKSFKRGS